MPKSFPDISLFRLKLSNYQLQVWTRQKEEWFNREVICSLEKGRERTGEIIGIYNEMRPHMSNDYLTPQQAHQQNGTLRRRWKTYYKKKEELCEQINEVM